MILFTDPFPAEILRKHSELELVNVFYVFFKVAGIFLPERKVTLEKSLTKLYVFYTFFIRFCQCLLAVGLHCIYFFSLFRVDFD